MNRTLLTLRKNARETLQVDLQMFKGKQLVSVRVWVPKSDTGELIATKRGISLRPDQLPSVCAALAEALKLLGYESPPL